MAIFRVMADLLDIALSGRTAHVSFSASGRLLAVAGYDGRACIVDAAGGRVVFKHAASGPRRDLPIHHHAFRADERFYAFSCVRRIFVVDLEKSALVAEVPVGEQERTLTVPFAIDPTSESVLLGNGSEVVRRPFDGTRDEPLFTMPHTGLSEELTVDDSGRFVAAKRGTGVDGALVVLHDRSNRTSRNVPVPYEYAPGRNMSAVRLRFSSDARSLLVLSKTAGFLRFDVATGNELERISWEELGFRSVLSFGSSRLDDPHLLVNSERSPTSDLDSWSVSVPGGLSWVLYDLVERRAVLEEANGEGGADVHAASRRVAWLRQRSTHGLKKDRLVVRGF